MGAHGKRRATLGFPGTGLSYTIGNDSKQSQSVKRGHPAAHGGRTSIIVVLLILAGLIALAVHLAGSH